ncbi:BglG family transcription antiterminator LicT [Robinsoniella peoriensis]|uniref:BglG family transcription antiterminator LicT n=1 Tax=Robinsoniella peoriensis TaxID=180332 RepID=UPI00085BAEFE|nr:PRD domain-containing protein [Robinsoniella peoriensis]
MRIFKALNNNVAVVVDDKDQEKIVMGRGICFKKKAGDDIDPEMIDKIFFLSAKDAHNKFQVLIQDIPIEHIAIGEEIISEARVRLEKKLNDMIYISLIDHVHTSILRFLDGVTVKNVLLWDIRRFYKDEFQVGLWALDLIQEKCKVRLPDDEAGFIALHLANAQMDQEIMHNMYEITTIMQEIANIVKYFYQIEFNEDDVYYYRFITHLKFFAKRLIDHNIYDEEDNDDLWDVIKSKYQNAFRCVEKITQFILKKYEYQLSKEEQIYLTIHIERVVNKAVS